MNGHIMADCPDYIVFTEQFGTSGKMSITVSRDRIVRIENLDVQVPEVTLRDILFFTEFPDKQFYKKPPYPILTDDSFFAVERIVKQQ